MERKYGFTGETKWISKCDDEIVKLYRIVALSDFGDVKKGELGGWIESYNSLSQEGNCWVYFEASVYDNATVYGNAKITGCATVCDNAQVYGDAIVSGMATVKGFAKVFGAASVGDKSTVSGMAFVFGKAVVCGKSRVYGEARICGNAKICDRSNVKDVAIVKGETEVRGLSVIHGDVKLDGCITYTNDDISSDYQCTEKTYDWRDLYYEEIVGVNPFTNKLETIPVYKVLIENENIDDVVLKIYMINNHIMVESNIFNGTLSELLNFIPHYLMSMYGIDILHKGDIKYIIPYQVAATKAQRYFRKFICTTTTLFE